MTFEEFWRQLYPYGRPGDGLPEKMSYEYMATKSAFEAGIKEGIRIVEERIKLHMDTVTECQNADKEDKRHDL